MFYENYRDLFVKNPNIDVSLNYYLTNVVSMALELPITTILFIITTNNLL